MLVQLNITIISFIFNRNLCLEQSSLLLELLLLPFLHFIELTARALQHCLKLSIIQILLALGGVNSLNRLVLDVVVGELICGWVQVVSTSVLNSGFNHAAPM